MPKHSKMIFVDKKNKIILGLYTNNRFLTKIS